MKVQPFPPSRTRSFALSSEGCQNSSSGECRDPFCALRVCSTAHGSPSSCRFHRGLVSPQALGDEGHRHRHGLHIFRSLQCAGFLANSRNVLHHALLHHNEEADQGKCSHVTRRLFTADQIIRRFLNVREETVGKHLVQSCFSSFPLVCSTWSSTDTYPSHTERGHTKARTKQGNPLLVKMPHLPPPLLFFWSFSQLVWSGQG